MGVFTALTNQKRCVVWCLGTIRFIFAWSQ